MRFTWVRVLAYTIAMAVPAVAQQPTLMTDEMSHVELSVGAGAMFAGPGGDLERRMVDLGLRSRQGRLQYPLTEPPNVVPGVFAQVNVGLSTHAMLGFFLGADQTTTTGRFTDGDTVMVQANVKTRAILASFRPTPWVKVAAGPALLERRLDFVQDGPKLEASALGWLVAGDAKLARRSYTPTHPPTFGYVTAQYRSSPGFDVPALVVPVYGAPRQFVSWAPQRVRMSHWMVGFGVGFEI